MPAPKLSPRWNKIPLDKEPSWFRGVLQDLQATDPWRSSRVKFAVLGDHFYWWASSHIGEHLDALLSYSGFLDHRKYCDVISTPDPDRPLVDLTVLKGQAAIQFQIETAGLYTELCKYSDPTSEWQRDLSVQDASAVAAIDPGLIYLEERTPQ